METFESEAERRQVTVVFCDLVDSSRLAFELDPEDLLHILRTYQGCCNTIVQRFGGVVGQYAGDGIVAYFGYPSASEDSVEQAIRAAREIVAAVPRLDLDDVRLSARVGMATGLVVVGDILGVGLSRQIGITGKVTILASRVQAVAAPDGIAIADSTRRLLANAFDCTDLGPHSLKGIDEPVRLWAVGPEGDFEARFDASNTNWAGPVVGRRRELTVLRRHHRLATSGIPQAVLLVGEPGIGKSTLIRTLKNEIRGAKGIIATLQCSPRHAHAPLYPISVYMQRLIGLAGGDDGQQKLQKLDDFLSSRGMESHREIFADLLSLNVPGLSVTQQLPAEVRRRNTINSILDVIGSLAAAGPLVIVLEDAQWADPTTQELFADIFASLREQNIFVMISSRPDEAKMWAQHEKVAVYHVPSLQSPAAFRLVEHLSSGHLSQNEIGQIVDRSDGVPLFLQELTAAALESKQSTQTNSVPQIPMSLQDGLTARFDRLGPIKKTAQIAAVLGRAFETDIVAEVTGKTVAAVSADLESLRVAGITRAIGRRRCSEYAFVHGLLQEAAYGSLLRDAKRRMHLKAAAVLKDRRPQLHVTEPETLAHHYEVGEDFSRSAELWLAAGQKAISRGSLPEAAANLQRGLNAFGRADAAVNSRETEFHLWLSLGQTTYVLKGPAHPETVAAYRNAQALLEYIPDPDMRCSTLYGIFSGYHFSAKFDLAEEPAQRMLDMASQSGRREDYCQAHRMIGYLAFFRADFPRAVASFEELARQYRQEDHGARAYRYGADCLVGTRGFHAVIESLTASYDEAVSRADENRSFAETLKHPASLGWAFAAACYARYFGSDHKGAESLGAQGAAYCRENNVSSWYAHCEVFRLWGGAHNQATLQASRAVRDLIESASRGNRLGVCFFRTVLSEILLLEGKATQAVEEAASAEDEVRQTGQNVFLPTALLVHGRCLVGHSEDPNAAVRKLDAGVKMSRKLGFHAVEFQGLQQLFPLIADQNRGGLEARFSHLSDKIHRSKVPLPGIPAN